MKTNKLTNQDMKCKCQCEACILRRYGGKAHSRHNAPHNPKGGGWELPQPTPTTKLGVTSSKLVATPTSSEWEEYVKNYIDFKTIEDRDVCLNWIKDLLLSERKRVREEMIEIIGEDEDEFEVGFYEGGMIGIIKKTGEEIPLRMQLRQFDRNDLRAELRAKLKEKEK